MIKQVKNKWMPSQYEFLKRSNDPIVALCASVGYGKSRVGTYWVVKRALCHSESAIVAAQTYKMTKVNLFEDSSNGIVSWLTRFGLRNGKDFKYNKSELKVTFPNGANVFGASSESVNSVTGMSNIANALIDESAIFDSDARQYIQERCRGNNADGSKIQYGKFRFIGSAPLPGHSMWYEDFLRENKSCSIFAPYTESIASGIGTQEYLDTNYKMTLASRGKEIADAQYYAKLIDNVADCSCVFYNYLSGRNVPVEHAVTMGIDCSGQGNDSTVYVVSNGLRVIDYRQLNRATPDEKIAIAIQLYTEHPEISRCNIDATGGYGESLTAALEKKYPCVYGINFGQAPMKECYGKARHEMYFQLAEHVPELPDGINLKKEMAATKWYINELGKNCLIPKEKIKKELDGRSPDFLDALALAEYDYRDYIPTFTMEDYEAMKAYL